MTGPGWHNGDVKPTTGMGDFKPSAMADIKQNMLSPTASGSDAGATGPTTGAGGGAPGGQFHSQDPVMHPNAQMTPYVVEGLLMPPNPCRLRALVGSTKVLMFRSPNRVFVLVVCNCVSVCVCWAAQ